MALQTSTGNKADGVGTFKGYMVPPDMLDADDEFNVRLDTPALQEHIRSIADNMKLNGFRRDKPLLIRSRGERSVVVDGHCRLSALRLAIAEGKEIVAVPCITEMQGTNEEDRVLTLITANAGLPLEPLEQAEAIKRLVAYGWSEEKVAAKCGKSRSWVTGRLQLAAAPAEIRKAVVEKRVSPTVAVKLAREEPLTAPATLAAAEAALKPGKTRVTSEAVRASRPTAPRLTPEQKAIRAHLTRWDFWRLYAGKRVDVPADLLASFEELRELLPATESEAA